MLDLEVSKGYLTVLYSGLLSVINVVVLFLNPLSDLGRNT
jgi:hypothetical protein